MMIFMHQQIRIYNIITKNCTKNEIGYELAHLFKGCREDCCNKYYHDLTLATPIMSDCDTTEGSISSITPYPTHTHIKNPSTMATNSRTLGANLPTAIAPSNGTTIPSPTISDHEGSIIVSALSLALIVVVVIIVIIIVTVVCILVCLIIRNHKSEQVSFEEQSNNIHLRTNFPIPPSSPPLHKHHSSCETGLHEESELEEHKALFEEVDACIIQQRQEEGLNGKRERERAWSMKCGGWGLSHMLL